MADERDTKVQEALRGPIIGEDIPNSPSAYREETASEVAVPIRTSYSLKKSENTPEIGASVPIRSSQYKEETAAEIAAPVPVTLRKNQNDTQQQQQKAGAGATAGTGMGVLALALSILSLFVMPILFGAAGIVLGFVARRRGAEGLGAWAIGIGAISIVVGIFILPFF
ncbi:hypothetical protein FB550_102484 [Neobacillus bataviensis]|uniref:DUF4190 domain-containing protein n=1 Tax=Neobacillus bataviensis TaxID=220685 RepID=A0A561DSW4_9BACI|nr:DUF308 domain-containing protein [Neobacillus bataviensis]TWE06462.1 hypothetical protein FB550_102484 [Neobacillus bataviensis]